MSTTFNQYKNEKKQNEMFSQNKILLKARVSPVRTNNSKASTPHRVHVIE